MDFIVSKVAMSVAALITVGAVGGIFDLCLASDHERELEVVLDDLSHRLILVSSSRPGSACAWTVPTLTDGGRIVMNLTLEAISASTSEHVAFRQPPVELHTWLWEGGLLNISAVQELDRAARPLLVPSGSAVVMEVFWPGWGDQATTLMTVSGA